MTPTLVLILGGIGAAILGLVGIRLTKHDNTPILDLVNEDELRSYRISRLIEGIGYCTLGKHEFRLLPGGSQNVCPQCLPPERTPLWEPHHQPEHRVRALNFGRAFKPVSAWWPELYEKGDETNETEL